MKTFTFKYSPNAPSISKQLTDSLGGNPYLKPNELVSKSLKAIFQLATEARLEIFGAIVNQQPNSINDLAGKLGKSQPYILKEVRTLESLGLIKLVQEFDGQRERLKPVALFSKIVIDCGFDRKEAA
jgi:predicted transcriptional regulator